MGLEGEEQGGWWQTRASAGSCWAVENAKQDLAGRKRVGLQENNAERNNKTFNSQQFSGQFATLPFLSLPLCPHSALRPVNLIWKMRLKWKTDTKNVNLHTEKLLIKRRQGKLSAHMWTPSVCVCVCEYVSVCVASTNKRRGHKQFMLIHVIVGISAAAAHLTLRQNV